MHTSKGYIDLPGLPDEELRSLVDRGRRILSERKLDRQSKSQYVLASQLIDGVRWTKEMIPCGNPRCKRCRERNEFHGPYYKPFAYNEATGKMKAGKPQREAPEGWHASSKVALTNREIFVLRKIGEREQQNPFVPFESGELEAVSVLKERGFIRSTTPGKYLITVLGRDVLNTIEEEEKQEEKQTREKWKTVLKQKGGREIFDRRSLKEVLTRVCVWRPFSSEEEIESLVDDIEAEVRDRERRKLEVNLLWLADEVQKRFWRWDPVAYLKFDRIQRPVFERVAAMLEEDYQQDEPHPSEVRELARGGDDRQEESNEVGQGTGSRGEREH